MPPKLSCSDPRQMSLANLNVFLAIPFLIMGICVNESITFGRSQDMIGLCIAILTFVCCLLSILRIWRPLYFWPVLAVIGVSLLISAAFVVFIHLENVAPHVDVLNRQRVDINGTDCYDNSTVVEILPSNDTLSADDCYYQSWIRDIKSGWSCVGSNVLLVINTVLVRPISLPA